MAGTSPVADPSGQHGVGFIPYETLPQLLTLIANMRESVDEMNCATRVIGQLIERVDYASPPPQYFPGGGGSSFPNDQNFPGNATFNVSRGGQQPHSPSGTPQSRNESNVDAGGRGPSGSVSRSSPGDGAADQSSKASSLLDGYSQLTSVSDRQTGAGNSFASRPSTPCGKDVSYYSGLGLLFGSPQSKNGSPVGGGGQQQQKPPGTPEAEGGLGFLDDQNFAARHQQLIVGSPEAAGGAGFSFNNDRSFGSGSNSSNPGGGGSQQPPGSPQSAGGGTPPPNDQNLPGNATFNVSPGAGGGQQQQLPVGSPQSPGGELSFLSHPSFVQAIGLNEESIYRGVPLVLGLPPSAAEIRRFDFQNMRIQCPSCGNRCALHIHFQYNGVTGYHPKEQEIGYYISLTEAGSASNVPSGDEAYHAPLVPPFEYRAEFYQSFDRMGLSCPFCRRFLNLKAAFSDLGPSPRHTHAHDIKLRIRVTNQDLRRDISP